MPEVDMADLSAVVARYEAMLAERERECAAAQARIDELQGAYGELEWKHDAFASRVDDAFDSIRQLEAALREALGWQSTDGRSQLPSLVNAAIERIKQLTEQVDFLEEAVRRWGIELPEHRGNEYGGPDCS